jgi:hypothetical protein
LTQYAKVFSGPFLVIKLKDLQSDPQNTLNKVSKFLGLTSNFEFTHTSKFHNVSVGRKRPISVWLRLRKIKLLYRIVHGLPFLPRLALKRSLSITIEERIRLTEKQKAPLIAPIREDLLKLRDDYGVDVGDWLKNLLVAALLYVSAPLSLCASYVTMFANDCP